MDIRQQESLPPGTSGFVITHCKTCAAGWTRTGEQGEQVIVCLLDRSPVWRGMVACDRYEGKDGISR